MDSGAGGGGATAIRVPYRHLRDAEMELVSLNGSPRAGEGPPKDPHQDADGARQAGGAGTSRTKLVLACMVAAGVQFGWALQLSLLTPYIQVKHTPTPPFCFTPCSIALDPPSLSDTHLESTFQFAFRIDIGAPMACPSFCFR
jgi:hypothetical protein